QAILDVREIRAAGEEAEEVLALRPLHAADRDLVREELARLRMREQERVELLDDRVRDLLRERPQARETREIVVGQRKECAAAANLGLVELQDRHESSVISRHFFRGRVDLGAGTS